VQHIDAAAFLAQISNIPQIYAQLDCQLKDADYHSEGHNEWTTRRRVKKQRRWYLNIIIYGNIDLQDKLGSYLSTRRLYLQNPLGCTRCVPYLNPHMLTSDSGETVMTDSFDVVVDDRDIETLEPGLDLLAHLMEDAIALPETEAPMTIKSTSSLFRYVHL
jgi:SWI/SNF-related matrix-associated actin-dependent regulator of chromatin subfamily A3